MWNRAELPTTGRRLAKPTFCAPQCFSAALAAGIHGLYAATV